MKQWIRQWMADAIVVGKIVAIIAVPTALLVFHVWHQYRIAEVGYEIADATTEHRKLLEENKKLVVEARLQGRSDRVSKLAEQHFGLREPDPDQIITIDDEVGPVVNEHARAEALDPSASNAAP